MPVVDPRWTGAFPKIVETESGADGLTVSDGGVYGRIVDNGGELFNVRHPRFAGGAKGDGSQDDAPAINTALAAARKTGEYGTPAGEGQPVVVPSGIYRLQNALNVTGSQFNLRGAGQYQTVLRGNTGAVGSAAVIDMAVNGYSSVRDLLIDTLNTSQSPIQSPSVLGILQARNPQETQAANNNLHNVVVRLGNSPTAHNNRGSVAVYNVGSETSTYTSVSLRADVPLYIGGQNLFGITSQYRGAIGDEVSMTVVGLTGASFLQALGGPACMLGGAACIDLGDAAMASTWWEAPSRYVPGAPSGYVDPLTGKTGREIALESTDPRYGPFPYAIDIINMATALRYRGSMEEFPGLLRVRHTLRGIDLTCYAAHGPADPVSGKGGHRIFLAEGAVLSGGRIDVVPNPGSSGGNLIQAQAGYSSVVEALDITLYEQGINLGPNGTLRGCTIRSTRSLADTLAGLQAGTRTGNVILAADGVHIDP